MEPTCESNPLVYLDITIGDEYAGRMVIELRKDVVPKTAENFRALCTGEKGIGECGKPLHYKGVRFHKVTRVYASQSGDVVKNDGTSGDSIYGTTFEDENFDLLHEEYVVSMANYGRPHTNNSQFIITSVQCDNLNGTNVVVGKVLRGSGIIGDMERNTSDCGQPTKEIVISDCGELEPGADWKFADCDESGETLPPYPHDWHRTKDAKDMKIHEVLDVLSSIRNAGNYYFARQRYVEARRKYRKSERYYLLFRNRYDFNPAADYEVFSEADRCQCEAAAAMAYINMAAAELKLGEYENARTACNEAIRIDSSCGKAYYRRGLANLAMNNYEEAIEDLTKAHHLIPDNKQILNELNRAKKSLAEYNRRQMSALSKMFN